MRFCSKRELLLSVWAYGGGIVVMGVVGQVINHITKKSKK
jgi:preprotein translocase subunit Sss1